MYAVITDWKLFVKLFISITLTPNKSVSNEPFDHDYINSMITTMTPDKNRPTNNHPTTPQSATIPLSRQAKRANNVTAYDDLIDVINCLFLPDLGCLHLRSEWYLHRGVNEHLPPNVTNEEHPCCGTACFVCNLTYVDYMRPIVYD